MVRSLRKGTTSMYFQHEHTGHSIGVKQCESEVDGGVAVLKVTVAPVDSNQKHDETYLHDEPLLSAAIDDKTVIEGFIAHVDSGVPKVEEYKLELVSRGKRLVKNVVPELAQQGNLRTLHLNVENR